MITLIASLFLIIFLGLAFLGFAVSWTIAFQALLVLILAVVVILVIFLIIAAVSKYNGPCIG